MNAGAARDPIDPIDPIDAVEAAAADPTLGERITWRHRVPARVARYGEPTEPLAGPVRAALADRGIAALYEHQARAVDALRAGRHVVLATGTASGKTLAFQVPVIEAMLAPEPATALFVYPTKALAQDQLRSLRAWLFPEVVAATYDGDTDPDERARVRRGANAVLTNPDMLHQGILPAHERWATFFMRLRYVVVDELHTLRGVFGSHVALIVRRLRRIAHHYGSDPTFCFTSATIGNPVELAGELVGDDVVGITDDGSPRAERELVVWERPLLDGARPSTANAETARLLAALVAAGHPTIAFTRSRRAAEIVAAAARRRLERLERLDESEPLAERGDRGGSGNASHAPGLAAQVASYRAGYLPAERRALEEQLVTGQLLGVAATNALELGIDVGELDAVVLDGFPGTLASFWQQVGRAGRRDRAAAAVLVTGDDQLDAWYARHPDELLARQPEVAVLNPGNPEVLAAQVACAARERPLDPSDERWFGPALDEAVRALVHADRLKPRAGRMYWAGGDNPAAAVGLRSGDAGEFELCEAGSHEPIGTVDGARVHTVAHPGAIYVHQGRQWRVEQLDLAERVAVLAPADDADEYTQPRTSGALRIEAVLDDEPLGAGRASRGAVHVTSRVVGYQRRRASTRELLETVPLDLPEQTLVTRACWYTLPAPALDAAGVPAARLLAAVHAAEHALIGMLPRFLICDRWDVGGLSTNLHPDTGAPTIFVYDGHAGGAGIAELAFAIRERHVVTARELVAACPCSDGCPSCVQSPKCGNGNEMLDKAAARIALQHLSPPADVAAVA